jgi:acetyl esterase/lipase
MTCQSNVVYGMYSGLALVMDVYRPETQNGYGIVYINGSGWHSPLAYNAEPLKATPPGMPYIEAMEYSGYTVFAINHRQAPRFKYPAAIEDAQRAVRFVRHNASHWGVHADRIGACGGSSGGHLVSLLGTLPGDGDASDPDPVNRESAAVQCVVARAAPVDMLSFVTSPIGSGSSVADFIGMLPRGEAEGPYSLEHRTYQEASPLHHVSANSPPFLLIHGEQDATVPFEQSERMLLALQNAGVPADLLPIPSAGHGPNFPGAVNPPDYLGAMVRWFDEHLRAR